MKIEIVNDNEFIVFLNNFIVLDLDYNDEEKLEKYFKRIFLKLKDVYDIDVCGFYDLTIYKDDNYGIVIEINKDNLYSDYFNQIDMRMTIKDTKFLYEINDFYNNGIIYTYKDKIYFEPKKKDYYSIGKLLEEANLIYKNTDMIIKSNIVRRYI